MGDAFRKVTSGEKFRPSARAWNALMDIAATRDGGDVGPDAPSFGRDATLVKIQNNTNTNLSRFAVVGLGTPLITPTQNEAEFKRQITFHGDTPLSNTHTGKFAILQQPLAINAIGWGLVAGVTPVNLNTLSTSNQAFADVINGNAVQLQAGASGAAQVMWVENTNNANTNAVVRLGVPQPVAFSGCKISNSVNLNCASGSTVFLTFDTESYDTDGYHVANSNTMTVPLTGYYLFGAHVFFSSNGTGARELLLYVNGSAVEAVLHQAVTSVSTQTDLYLSTEAHLNAGDAIKVAVFQDSGAGLSIVSSSAGSPVAWIHRIG